MIADQGQQQQQQRGSRADYPPLPRPTSGRPLVPPFCLLCFFSRRFCAVAFFFYMRRVCPTPWCPTPSGILSCALVCAVAHMTLSCVPCAAAFSLGPGAGFCGLDPNNGCHARPRLCRRGTSGGAARGEGLRPVLPVDTGGGARRVDATRQVFSLAIRASAERPGKF